MRYNDFHTKLKTDIYCVEGISETTGASSDVYCQSNNDDHIRERERDIVDWGERERT